MKKILNVVLLSMLLSTASFANTVGDFQTWIPININLKVSEKIRGFLELQPRFINDVSSIGTVIVRPAVGYAIDSKNTIWAGYGMQASEIGTTDSYKVENRVWQGYSWKSALSENGTLEIRNRLEERFIPYVSDVSVRWRTRARYEFQLPRKGWSLISSDELFLNMNDNKLAGLESGIDQNRAYLGIGYRFSPEFQIETGYLNQFVVGGFGANNKSNNVWVTNLNINL